MKTEIHDGATLAARQNPKSFWPFILFIFDVNALICLLCLAITEMMILVGCGPAETIILNCYSYLYTCHSKLMMRNSRQVKWHEMVKFTCFDVKIRRGVPLYLYRSRILYKSIFDNKKWYQEFAYNFKFWLQRSATKLRKVKKIYMQENYEIFIFWRQSCRWL